MFYDRLGKIERNAEKGTHTPDPYQYLATGRVSKLPELQTEYRGKPAVDRTYAKREIENDVPSEPMSTLQHSITKISRALAAKSNTQDVRSEAEKEQEREHEM